MRWAIVGSVAGLLALGAAAVTAGPQKTGRPATAAVDFNRDARPILSGHCFKCHGPDDKQRMAGLRLDTRAGAVAKLKSGKRAVVPGKPGQSEFLRRIAASGPLMMPPAHANKPLSAAQKRILQQWVAQGAVYKTHWAFVPPQQAAPPSVKNAAWARNPIDRFVLARLEKAGLKPSPEAGRAILLRRVTFDLIGLPPTPEEADAFLADKSPNAYEKVVDRLLASPRYGERWARRWLDLARYADTNGYEKDRPRSIWLYRDWVIAALNADMPFDRFTIAQIAGDMLPNATQEQKIATGFHRNTMLNEEGGIDPLEFRFHAMTDRVATTGTTWLGLTTGCAQCHTHKYDPITHKEYYQFMALTNNADELTMEVPKPDIAQKRQEIEAQAAAREAAMGEKFPAADGVSGAENLKRKFADWLRGQEAKAARWTPLKPVRMQSNLPLLTVLEDGSVLASGDQTKRDVYDLTFRTGLKGITAIRLEALPDARLPRSGPGRIFYEGPHGDFILSELTLTAGGQPVKLAKGTHSFANGAGAPNVIDGSPQTGWSVNGGQGKAHSAVFTLEKPLDAPEFAIRLLSEFYYACALGRFRISVTTDAKPAEAGLPAALEEIALLPEAQRAPEQTAQLRQHFLSIAPELAKEREEIQKLRQQMPAFPTTLVFSERPANNPRPTTVHHRGEFLQAKERVQPNVFAFLNPLPKNAPRNRLTFARWLVSPSNPLTARVTMNRQWAAFFGQGIVTTLEDFGFQGQPPTHPALLDWLAVEFIRQDWSLKKMHRLMVTSATYRQSSRVTPPLLAKDPLNKLLARGPRLRLEAEMLRDSALAVSGLLSGKIGGPSVFPPQPPGVSSEGAYGPLEWKVSPGEDRYRRGLYTFAKRTAPYAMFTTFDAPSGEACVARREVSNTPLQALTLLNDAVFVEAAQALGRMLAARQGTVAERATYLFRRCVTRPPTQDELALLVRFLAAQKEQFAQKEQEAAAVAGEGQGDVVERAAWTALSRSLLNLDEAVTRG